MSKVVFFSIPAYGHTNPTLPLVEELVKRGEEVIYYSTNEFKEKILATGAEYRAYVFSGHDYDSHHSGKNLSFLYYLMIKITVDQLDVLLDAIQDLKPDYIIHDAICAWGRYVAAVCKIPAISSITTFALYEKGISIKKVLQFFKDSGLQGVKNILSARKMQRALFKKYGVQPRSFVETMMNEEGLNIVYTSEAFQPNEQLFDKQQYAFIGPSITERKNDVDKTNYASLSHPLVYLSMGTIWNGIIRIDEIIHALASCGYSVVVSGIDTDTDNPYGKNVILRKYVNQIEVLKHCDVFITHGGMNSVSEALYWGVPLCIHPFQTEQAIVADRVVELGCGLKIDGFDPHTVLEMVSVLQQDNTYKANCEIIASSFRQAGGVKAGVDRILAYVNH